MDAKLCEESSCWSPDTPQKSHLSSSYYRNTPSHKLSKNLIQLLIQFIYLPWFEHCLWFCNFFRSFQSNFLPCSAIKHSENRILSRSVKIKSSTSRLDQIGEKKLIVKKCIPEKVVVTSSHYGRVSSIPATLKLVKDAIILVQRTEFRSEVLVDLKTTNI